MTEEKTKALLAFGEKLTAAVAAHVQTLVALQQDMERLVSERATTEKKIEELTKPRYVKAPQIDRLQVGDLVALCPDAAENGGWGIVISAKDRTSVYYKDEGVVSYRPGQLTRKPLASGDRARCVRGSYKGEFVDVEVVNPDYVKIRRENESVDIIDLTQVVAVAR